MQALAVRSEASPAHNLSRRRELVREWLAKFAANHNRKMDDDGARVMLALWVESFADVPSTPGGEAMLEAAFRETLLRSDFFPSIASIRSHFPAARAKVFVARSDARPALPEPNRRNHHCAAPVPLAQVVDVFRGVARELPPPKVKERPVKPVVFCFPDDPDHESRVREQAAEMRAKAAS